MVAAAGGGLANTFRGIEGREMRAGEAVNVVLGWIPEMGPALLSIDSEDPRAPP
jgi:hypothetical protein